MDRKHGKSTAATKNFSNVLAIDDELTNLQILNETLSKFVNLKTITNARQAISFTQNVFDIDLVILDIKMPVIDGFNVIKKIKQYPHMRNIPYIFLSSSREVEDIVLGRELGAIDYLLKPIAPSKLIERVIRHLVYKVYQDMSLQIKRNEMLRIEEIQPNIRKIDRLMKHYYVGEGSNDTKKTA